MEMLNTWNTFKVLLTVFTVTYIYGFRQKNVTQGSNDLVYFHDFSMKNASRTITPI